MDETSYALFCETVGVLAKALKIETPELPARESLNYVKAITFYNQMTAKPPSVRKYAITLTTKPAPKGVSKSHLADRSANFSKLIYSICKSKLVAPLTFSYSLEHPDTNLHAHIYLETQQYIKARDILRMNQGNRVDVKLLKGLEVPKWLNYIAKDVKPIKLV